MKQILILALTVLIPFGAFAAMRRISGEGLKPKDRAAININFDEIEKKLLNAVTKHSRQEIRGLKIFYNTIKLAPTDTPPTCNAGLEGGVYYDDSLDELCDCNGSSWAQVDGGGGC